MMSQMPISSTILPASTGKFPKSRPSCDPIPVTIMDITRKPMQMTDPIIVARGAVLEPGLKTSASTTMRTATAAYISARCAGGYSDSARYGFSSQMLMQATYTNKMAGTMCHCG